MTSMLVNIIVAFWLLLFGAMAIVPFMIQGKPHARTTESTATASAHAEDRVISIRPVGMGVDRPQPEGQTPASILAAASARAAAQASQDGRSGSGNHHHRQAA
jgi:hypothetical protein